MSTHNTCFRGYKKNMNTFLLKKKKASYLENMLNTVEENPVKKDQEKPVNHMM